MKGVFYSAVTVMLLVPLLLLAYAWNEAYINSKAKEELVERSLAVGFLYENLERRAEAAAGISWTDENITFSTNKTPLTEALENVTSEIGALSPAVSAYFEVGDLEARGIRFDEERTFFRSSGGGTIVISTPEEGDPFSDCLGGSEGEVIYAEGSVPYGDENCVVGITNFTSGPDVTVDVKMLDLGYVSVEMEREGNATFLKAGEGPDINFTLSSGFVSKTGKLR